MIRALELGCGPPPWKNNYNADELYGVDLYEDLENNIRRADLVIDPIPFESEYFDLVAAFDLIEHIPRLIYAPARRYPFVELMNEIYRVLKVEGYFVSVTPAFPNPAAFRDPTHVNVITEETFFGYFDDKRRWAAIYGFVGAFRPILQEWNGYHLITQMYKVPVP